MKILHVVAGLFDAGGGVAEVVPRMCEALKECGDELRILTMNWGPISDATKRAIGAGVTVHDCVRDPRRHFVALGFSAEFDRRLIEDVCWADVVHLHGNWQRPCWLAATLARKMGKPYVMQPHGSLEPERLKKSAVLKRIVGTLIERPRLNHAARVVATAESEREHVVAYGVRTPVEVVPIGIDTGEIDRAIRDEHLLRRLGVPRGKRVVLYFSRIAPIKGLDMLAKAWRSLSTFHDRWHLLVVGPDTQGHTAVVRADFAEKVKDGSVSIVGPIYGSDKFSLLKSVDAFVLPTRSENFSIAVQQALAAGIPVVCTKGAPWACLEGSEVGGRCGYWVDISSSAIAEGLRKVMELSTDERRVLGENGQDYVKKTFSWQGVSDRMREVYRSVADENRTPVCE